MSFHSRHHEVCKAIWSLDPSAPIILERHTWHISNHCSRMLRKCCRLDRDKGALKSGHKGLSLLQTDPNLIDQDRGCDFAELENRLLASTFTAYFTNLDYPNHALHPSEIAPPRTLIPKPLPPSFQQSQIDAVSY